MNTKNILLGVFSLLTVATYAQTRNSKNSESKITVTEFKMKSENLDELKNFDTNTIKKIFQENDPEIEITLAFAYVNKSEMDKSKVRVDNFEMKLTGKTADLDKLTARLKKIFEKLDEIDGQLIEK